MVWIKLFRGASQTQRWEMFSNRKFSALTIAPFGTTLLWQLSDRRYAIVCNSQFHPFFIVLFGKFNMQHAAANSCIQAEGTPRRWLYAALLLAAHALGIDLF
ncbi:hypothetical protein TGPRC2_207403 [Toxoplasma gondii TgCatPRC2]|uniref:Uncharacterized protein n=4 Tax=Toxoplasma gondii TaxID=5811 RepID=A0A125YI22_TOXGV|nr:hypothetical protein TGME49_207403 [Toxoplasma gondii ME49]EPT32462.1 hypothetical protein TGME49_207403 [Toxoplasma gondii ME49]ESS29359.1 hypothetical protein TGVEG_207403 [Toxoplasma gondii VEG]KYF41437.1 hypothetical protein TGARI_207403 [Toxoplasma gondii ARI]KYK68415.1 hypothetical protein TGPRC2_207403 [Toxoplasma gondii TgCatPRC2]|eukprot:XP_018638516.1 hypothetical protein TGME49_207403 [Toxoplasma gondii ME49]